MPSKKMLVPFDIQKPDKKFNRFLYPNMDMDIGEAISFLEISKGKNWEAGMVVYTGVEITKKTVFAKIVDSGKKVESVKELLDCLEEYLRQIALFKIGDIVGIKSVEDGFELIKLKKPKSTKRKLP